MPSAVEGVVVAVVFTEKGVVVAASEMGGALDESGWGEAA